MREMLFRGKRLDNGEWVYGSLLQVEHEDGSFTTAIFHKKDAGGDAEVSPSTIGQYTGLLDKHGKMIWEGDVIKWDYTCNEGKPHQVRYDVGSACFVASREHNGNIIDTVFYNDGKHAEVIGNITDNPELLEK